MKDLIIIDLGVLTTVIIYLFSVFQITKQNYKYRSHLEKIVLCFMIINLIMIFRYVIFTLSHVDILHHPLG